MQLTVENVQEFTLLVARHPEWQVELRRLVLTDELLELPNIVRRLAEAQERAEERLGRAEERLAGAEARLAGVEERLDRGELRLEQVEVQLGRLETTVAELAEAQRRTELRVEELAEAQRRTELRVEELAEAQRRTESRIQELTTSQLGMEAILKRLVDRVGKHSGQLLEMAYRDKAYAYFGTLVRKVRVVPLQSIEEQLEDNLAPAELEELAPLDLLVRGLTRDTAAPTQVYLAIEVSSVVDKEDVDRAAQRAYLLRKAGLRAVPVAAGESLTAGAEDAAERSAVLLVWDGKKKNWEAALHQALSL